MDDFKMNANEKNETGIGFNLIGGLFMVFNCIEWHEQLKTEHSKL